MKTCNLKAALKCVSRQALRPELETVCVEFADDKIYVVGSDGVVLFASVEDNHGEITSGTVLIPMAVAALALKNNVKSETIRLGMELGVLMLGNIRFTDTGAKYRDWRRVVPQTLSGVAGHFDPALLVRVHGAIDIANGAAESSVLHQNGNHAAIVRGVSPDAICVVMPLRVGNIFDWIPVKHFMWAEK